jgi:putative aldouronate transport system permease protein
MTQMKHKNKIKRNPGDQLVQVLIYVIVAVFAAVTVMPFIYVLAGSFATERELTERAFFLIPREFSLNAYRYIIKTGDVFRGLRNSAIVTLGGTIICMFFTTTLAYPLSRSYLRGRNFFINMVIITMLFSGGMVPSYLVVTQLGLHNTYWALWLPTAINAFNMIIVKNYFQGIPKELEEAARVDGSSDLTTFVRIILPLSKPTIASVSLFYAVYHWNSYFNAMLYIDDKKKEVVQIALRRIIFLAGGINIDGSPIDWGTMGQPPEKAVKMATTVVATLPILLIYPFIQKYFTQGVMVGAVKG